MSTKEHTHISFIFSFFSSSFGSKNLALSLINQVCKLGEQVMVGYCEKKNVNYILMKLLPFVIQVNASIFSKQIVYGIFLYVKAGNESHISV